MSLSLAICQAQSYKRLATPRLELTLLLHSVRVAREWSNLAAEKAPLETDRWRATLLRRGTARSRHTDACIAACCARRLEYRDVFRGKARPRPIRPVPEAR